MNREKDKELFNKIAAKSLFAIGSDLYDDSRYKKLSICKNDALDLYKTFEKTAPLMFDKSNSVVLVNEKDVFLTKKFVLNNLKKFLENVNNDFLIFYFSGHGDVVDNKLALILKDSDYDRAETLLFFNEILENIEKVNCNKKLIILDTCFSGLANTNKSALSPSRKVLKNIICKSQGTTIITSSLDQQKSSTKSPSKQNSLFTYYLLEGLKGAPRALKNNYLSVFGLYEYIVENVATYVSDSSLGEQTPTIYSNQDGILVLGDYRFNGNRWYKDNYEKIIIKDSLSKFDQYFNEIKIDLDADIWQKSRFVIFEIVNNAFKHGNAKKCEIIINENSLIIKDDGGKFNQLENCNSPCGGLSLSFKNLKAQYEKDVLCEYKFDCLNTYSMTFSSDHVFDITKRMCLTCESISSELPTDFFIPEVICKYYLIHFENNVYHSTRKSLVEDALSLLPKGSKLLLIESELVNADLYSDNPNIEIINS